MKKLYEAPRSNLRNIVERAIGFHPRARVVAGKLPCCRNADPS
jgi:hypothetical protein